MATGELCKNSVLAGRNTCKAHIPKCNASTMAGNKCKLNALDGESMCHIHLGKPMYVKPKPSSTITITFCDSAENHVGMQIVRSAKLPNAGFAYDMLRGMYEYDTEQRTYHGYVPSYSKPLEFIDLTIEGSPQACVLVIRNYLDKHITLMEELKSLDWDKKYYSYGTVKNKQARWNLVFAEDEQEPCYEDGKGRIVGWNSVPLLSSIKKDLDETYVLDTVAEGNYYYANTCGIGYHGDRERSYVIGLRVGDPMPLSFRWFKRTAQVGKTININLNGGDLYIMSDVAVGKDWLETSHLTLRHAAGADKYVNAK